MDSGLARRLAATAAMTAGGIVVALAAQAVEAALRPYLPADSAPPVEGGYGDQAAPPLRLVLLGDSTAAGVGVAGTDETVGGRLAAGLAAHWQVRLDGVGVSGSRVGDLGPQVSRALLLNPDVAVILIGANDTLHPAPMTAMAERLEVAVRRLHDAGVGVVVGTCPDMGARAFRWPLRELVAWQGRRVATACAIAAHRGGAGVVPIGELCGPLFRHDPSTLSEDNFHPSARGYELWAEALLPAVREAVSLRAGR